MKNLIYFSFFTLLITSCGKFNSCKTYYTFEMPVTISPVNDTVSIGDTLWLEINVTSLLKDRESNTVIDVKDQMLTWDENMMIFFRKIVFPSKNIADQEDAVSKFDFIYETGKFVKYTGNLAKGMEFYYNNGQYLLKTGIIPKESGIFFFTFMFDNKSTNVHEGEFDVNLTDTKCKEVLSEIYYEVNKQNDGSYNTNRDVLLQNLTEPYSSELDKFTYTFVVE